MERNGFLSKASLRSHPLYRVLGKLGAHPCPEDAGRASHALLMFGADGWR